MIDLNTLRREFDNRFYYYDRDDGQKYEYQPMFPAEEWDDPEAFHMAGITGYDPMTAKELDTEESQTAAFSDPNNVVEEKFDGTRGLLYFMRQITVEGVALGFTRLFSRRISRKTGFYVENTDSCPQLREIDVPELGDTIIDGELFINGLPFKEVSSTLNCLWDKAVDRQIEKGFITFHAFDCLFYKGRDLRGLPLLIRKVFLARVIEEAASPYIEEVRYFSCGDTEGPLDFNFTDELTRRVGDARFDDVVDLLESDESIQSAYPALAGAFERERGGINVPLTPQAYYEMIVFSGGEGVIVKSKDGLYHHKRGWEYSKVKKFLTRELIVLGFSEPTREYTGKDIRNWSYWVDSQNQRVTGNFFNRSGYTAVTKFYYHRQVGNLLLGVLIPKEDYEKIPKNKKGVSRVPSDCNLDPRLDIYFYVMEVCECAGYDDDTRAEFTKNRDDYVGTVVEVKANELFRDTGKLRHPRFLRVRHDKEPERCLWEDHIS